MKNYKHSCVIDAAGFYITLVLVIFEPAGTGETTEEIQGYTLKSGEYIIDTAPPSGFIKPKWNGSAWEETATSEEIAAADTRTLEEAMTAKLSELDANCNAVIVAGCDVNLSNGVTGHISLTDEDQINLTTALGSIQQGASGYPYHLDGQLCAVFAAADILTMATAATAHKLYHTTYINHLHIWVRRCTAKSEVDAITYGSNLPVDLAGNMAAIMAATMSTGGGNA